MTRRQWLGTCLLAMLAGCNGTPSTVDAPKQATDDTENTNMSTEPSQSRDSVPLTRPLSLSTEAGTQRWKFEVGQPGENSGSSLILGFRMCVADSNQVIAVEDALFDDRPIVELHLTEMSGGQQSAPVPLTFATLEGVPPEPVFETVPASGEVTLSGRTSVDKLAMQQAGIDRERETCPVYEFAYAKAVSPGRYALSLTPKGAYSPPKDASIELLVAYANRGK